MAKVMLVEDDNNLREIYEARLQAEGYTIVAAKDGEEALVIAKAEKPDLIISDVMMPRISGFEMLDILRNTDGLKEVKVIMLTALGQSDDQQRADRLGADRYLVKSQVTLEDIVKVAHELLQDTPAAPAEAAAPATPAPAAPSPDPIPVAPAPPEPTATPDPASAPEPAAAPAPAAAPTPAEPVTTPSASSATDDQTVDGAQTTSQEEASVEAQIEDFVAGASSEPTAATPTAPVDPASAPEPAAAPTPPEPVAPAPEPTPAPAPAAEPKEEKPQNDNVTIAHKKVIEPLGESSGKPDINTLLAAEEAKEAAQPQPPTAVVATNETGQQATPLTPPAEGQAPQATDFAAGAGQATTPPPPSQPGQAATGEDPNAIAL